MKTLQFKMILIIGLLLTMITACDKNDQSINNIVVDEVQNIVETGNWVITNFNDSGKDETHHFNGFEFSFLDNGVLESTNGRVMHKGVWNISHDSSDDNDSETNFNIYFTSAEGEFEELTDDWEIISQSPTKIELIDISGGNGGTDYLTFERI